MIKLNEIINNWEKQKEWHGNPSLGLESYKKIFVNPNNRRKVPVYVFGKDKEWHFVVSAGANSEYSYTGGFPEEIRTSENIEDKLNYVDKLYNTKYKTPTDIRYGDDFTVGTSNKLFK